MLQTFIALLAAHAVADFVLQFDWIMARKRRWSVFTLHIAIVAATAALALGVWPGNLLEAGLAVGAVAAVHAVLDGLKTWGRAPAPFVGARGWSFEAYCFDQIGHLISIAVIAALFPGAFAAGVWAAHTPDGGALAVTGLAFVAGFLIATRTGQFFVAEFMARFELKETKDGADDDRGLVNGGAWIGLLERAFTFVLVLAGRFDAIGFLIAAKSILRFSYAAKDRSRSEYVIIGTLISFGWAVVAASATNALLQAL